MLNIGCDKFRGENFSDFEPGMPQTRYVPGINDGVP